MNNKLRSLSITLDSLVSRNVIHNMQKVNDNSILIACVAGIYLYDYIKQEILDKNTSVGTVLTITKTREGFYLGTGKGDYIKLNIKNAEMELNHISHLPSTISTISFDKNNRVWLATYYGLYYLNKSSDSLFQYPISELSTHEFNRFSHYFDKEDNQLYLGTISGLNFIDLNEMNSKKEDHHIYLTQYIYYDSEDKGVVKRFIPPEKEAIQLPPGNHYFSIDFRSGLNFLDPGLSYQYKLDASRWIDIYDNRNITFHNLAVGEHKLLIRAVSGSGSLSDNKLSLKINVQKVFYKKAWFIIAVTLLLCGIVALWIRRILTEKKRMERVVQQRTRELQELSTSKDQFFANISHELKTPLTLIYSPIRSVLKDAELKPETKSKIQRIFLNINTLKNRIGELLDLATMKEGKTKLDTRIFDLRKTMNNVLDVFKDIAEEKNISYNATMELPSIMVESDRKKIEKIFQNLINNAIKYTPSGGSVDIDLKWKENKLYFRIADTGIGIPDSEQQRIFDKFYRIEQSEKVDSLGSGIGLSLVKEFIELLKGEIDLKSELNKGTTFTVTLPLHKVVTAQDSLDLLNVPIDFIPETVEGEKTILLVEDNRELSEYIASMIQPYYKCIKAIHGKEAIEKLKENSVDMIISDIMMPEMDGIALLEHVRNDVQYRNLPILFLTASANVRTRIHSYTLGVDDYMTKPFEEEELLVRVSILLKNRKNRIEFLSQLSDSDEEDQDSLTIQNIQAAIFENLTHPEFSINYIAEQFSVHRRTLERFIKSETGLTPTEIITEARLVKAWELLESGSAHTVGEVVSEIGLKNKSYFSRKFRERFGLYPSELL